VRWNQVHWTKRRDKGLGKIQKVILKEIYRNRVPSTTYILNKDIQEAIWGDVLVEMCPELNRRRAKISAALHSLETRLIIGQYMGIWYLENEGLEAVHKILDKEKEKGKD